MRWTVALAAVFFAAGAAGAETNRLSEAAIQAVNGDPSNQTDAINILRQAGQPGLDQLLQIYRAASSPDQQRMRSLVDAVAMQKDAAESGLYWYTDLDLAKAEAVRTGKPILSLRMLGKLNEDLSCANSRFFRTTLYPNKEISGYLREHFILHWESVRPVPVVTIDMGDGRKLVRTLTGNSIHYVLDAKGRVVDGLPGLYGPAAFMRLLRADEAEAQATAKLDDAEFVEQTTAWHNQCVQTIEHAYDSDVKNANISGPMDDTAWEKIAQLHADDAVLDANAQELMRRKIAKVAMVLTVSKRAVEDPLLAMVQNVEGMIGLDTVKNEYVLHKQLHQWLGASTQTPDLRALNNRVYAQMFKTPANDPWLGLAPADVYSAIDNGGVISVAANNNPSGN